MNPHTRRGRWLALTLLTGCVRIPIDANPTPSAVPGQSSTVTDVHVEPLLMSGCAVTAAPAVFTVDIAFIKPPEGTTLMRLAHCLTRGRLQGRRIRLVEYAALIWPNGDSATVDALHAYAVRDYLMFHGVKRDAVDVASERAPLAGSVGAGDPPKRRVDVRLIP